MPATLTHDEVTATLKRLEKKDPGLKRLLQKAHGYAVFPSVGKAAVVLGGSYGRGEVFEKGKFIGHATIAQFTVGVQLGGDTFAEVIVFETKPALERFKQGKMAFAANASAVLVKAGAAAANNFNRGVAVFAYSEGGMLLEAAIGGQKFKFKPASKPDSEQGQGQEQSKSGKSGKGQQGRAESSDEGEEEEEQDEGAEEGEGEESDETGDGTGFMGRALGGVKDAASSVGGMAKQHPVYATIIGAGLVTGLAMMIARSVRGSSGDAEEDEGADGQEESEDENEGLEASSEDEGEDSGEEEEQNGDGDEEEDEPRFMKRGRARA